MNTKSTLVALAISLLSMTAVSSAHAETINFDEITLAPGAFTALSVPLGATYQGFTWTNFFALNTLGGSWEKSGYVPGSVSGSNVGLNGEGKTASFSSVSSSTFTLNSFDLTAVWVDGLSVKVSGYNGSNLVADRTFEPLADRSTLVTLNWAGVNRVTFEASGGTHHPGYETTDISGHVDTTNTMPNFAIDNIAFNVSSVPEPESYAMLLAGLGALGFVGRRRRQQG